jgi:hypothetical protein
MTNTSHRLALLGSVATLAIGSLAGTALAKGGADDPAGHNKGDDNGGKVARIARSGADDPVGHDRFDDKVARRKLERHHRRHHRARAHAARHGRDDGPNHDKGDDKGAR